MKHPNYSLLALVISGLLLQSPSAHAGNSFFDSLNHVIKKLSKTVQNEINNYYCENTQDDLPELNTTIASAPPAPAAPIPESPLAPCKKYLDLIYDTSLTTDPKQIATIYLNGVLDFQAANFDAKLSDEEIDQRNKCVVLALDAGADPDSNGLAKDASKDSVFADSPGPLARAVNDGDIFAVKILLDHKANPNALDTSVGRSIPLLSSAVYKSNQDIALLLINAGADVTAKDLLWSAAGNAEDKVVDALIQSKKIPVNQVDKFSDYPDDKGETALDASERAIFALKAYQKKFTADPKASLQDKIEEVNHILYYTYPLKPQLKVSAGSGTVDPDAIINDLLTHQQSISNSLKSAGWSCLEDNCGIVDFSSDASNS